MRCPTCNQYWIFEKGAAECEICIRRRAIGVLVEMVIAATSPELWYPALASGRIPIGATDRMLAERWKGFDVIADLLGERVRARVRHNKELREEARESSRAARESYDEGFMQGRIAGID